MTINTKTANAIVERFGYTTTGKSPCHGGFFLAPVTRDRFGRRHFGSDEMLVCGNGAIIPYEDNAQAFLAATALANAMRSCAA